jgi:hypothetical protein
VIDTTEIALDGFQAVKHVERCNARSAMRDEVQKRPIPLDGRIVRQHRGRLDDRRYAYDADAVRAQPLESSGEMFAPVAQVRSQPEVNVNHRLFVLRASPYNHAQTNTHLQGQQQ